MTKHFVLATLLSCGALLRKVDKPLKYKKAVNNLVLKKKTNKPDSSTSMENQGQLFSNLPEFFAANFIPTLVSRARFAFKICCLYWDPGITHFECVFNITDNPSQYIWELRISILAMNKQIQKSNKKGNWRNDENYQNNS